MRLGAMVLAVAVWAAPQSAALAAPGDGFAPFWQAFTVALAKDDKAALARMVVLSPELDEASPLTFARFHADYLGPKTRQCLAKAKPVRDVDGLGKANYSAFCGELDFSFYQSGGGWKLTGIGPND